MAKDTQTDAHAADRATPGVDEAALEGWFRQAIPGVRAPLRCTLIAGGRSNLTFLVADASGRRWVLRRPPMHSVLPSAHDVGREHRIVAALAETSVPVPRAVAQEDDPAVLGASFFLMDFVEGDIIRDATMAATLSDEQRRHAGESLVDVLADLHAVEPQRVGLGDLARPTSYVARQLRGLHRQLDQRRAQGGRDLPLLEEAHRRLSQAVPMETRQAILHGDYRLDNMVLGPDGNIRAVLDWELCALGDPMADVAMLAIFWPDSGDEAIPGVATQTVVTGFPRRHEALQRYTDRTGTDLSRLDYYCAFARWKLAVILEGVHSRFAGGAYGETSDDSWRLFEDVVPRLAAQSLEALDRDEVRKRDPS